MTLNVWTGNPDPDSCQQADKLREAAQLALEALDAMGKPQPTLVETMKMQARAAKKLRAALAQQDVQAVPTINYALLYEFSNANGVSYNSLCKVVWDALNAAPTPPAQQDAQAVPLPEHETEAAQRDAFEHWWANRLPGARQDGYLSAWAAWHSALAQRVMLTDEEIRDLWSWSMTAEAERTANTQQHAFAQGVIEAYERKNGIK